MVHKGLGLDKNRCRRRAKREARESDEPARTNTNNNRRESHALYGSEIRREFKENDGSEIWPTPNGRSGEIFTGENRGNRERNRSKPLPLRFLRLLLLSCRASTKKARPFVEIQHFGLNSSPYPAKVSVASLGNVVSLQTSV